MVTSLTDAFDENPNLVAWTTAGIFFSASQRTWAYLFSLDPATGGSTRHAPRDEWIGAGFSLTRDGARVAFIQSGPSEFPDVYVAPVPTMAGMKVSDTGAQMASWPGTLAKWCAGRARTAPTSRASCTSRPTSRPAAATRCWS